MFGSVWKGYRTLVEIETLQYPVRENMFVVEGFRRWVGSAYETIISLDDVGNKSLYAVINDLAAGIFQGTIWHK